MSTNVADVQSFYDSQGNLDCTTASGYTGTACPAAGNTHLKVDYLYDYRNRLVGTRTYSAGALTASTDIAIDALDRPVSQTSGGATTTFAYTGTSNRVATETKGSAVKSYGYGAYGERLTITDGANRYSYLYNQHGDVSLLIDQANTVKQAYGYTAYGGVDTTITKNASGFTDPNPYRYSAKRWDAATGTYDMGARRYNPATTRWVQQDMYYGSVENLGLSRDPLTANRYQFTGANPINFVEIDGHKPGGTGFDNGDGPSYTVWGRNDQARDLAYCADGKAETARKEACDRAGRAIPGGGPMSTQDKILTGVVLVAALVIVGGELIGTEVALASPGYVAILRASYGLNKSQAIAVATQVARFLKTQRKLLTKLAKDYGPQAIAKGVDVLAVGGKQWSACLKEIGGLVASGGKSGRAIGEVLRECLPIVFAPGKH